jgi:hypothetical protein
MSDTAAVGAGTAGEGGDAGASAGAATGAAAILTGGDSGAGDAGAGAAGAGTGGNAGAGAASEDWFAGLSEEAVDGGLSDRAWIANKAYADLSALVKAARSAEARMLAGDKIVIPKEGDAPEVFENFYKAIGRPDAPDGYTITAPEGRELDVELVSAITAAAYKAGTSNTMLEPLVEAFNDVMVQREQQAEAERAAAKDQDVAAVRAEWGEQFSAKVAQCNQAMRMLELSQDDIGALEDAWGTARTFKLLQRLGAGMAEDALIGGGAAVRFGVSPAEAKAELNKIETDPALAKKYREGDAALKARHQMLVSIIAQDEQRRAAA